MPSYVLWSNLVIDIVYAVLHKAMLGFGQLSWQLAQMQLLVIVCVNSTMLDFGELS
uniref:Uncharacterized protein n=1 Tax=Arundo donax TaxID=35708 RepID=A0A0A8YJX4_ARUDO